MQAKIKEQYHKILDEKKPILLTVAGSALFGLSSGDKSDRDEIGVYIEDMREVAGFGSEQHVVWRSAEARTGNPSEPSKAGDVDLTLYGLRKFLRLALGGNPTVLNVFYAPVATCSILSDVGKALQDLVPSVLSRRAGNAFLGYLNQQRLRLLGERGQMRVHRPEVVATYGFDTKYAMHMLRLGIQGKELLQEGKLRIPLAESWQTYLQDVRDGEVPLNSVLDVTEDLEKDIKNLMDSSTLPKEPDFDKVEAWMLRVYKENWK